MQAHQPTAQNRTYVELLTACGIPQAAIAGLMGISVPTLTAHYRDELDFGKQKMLGQVGATLFQGAIGRPARFDETGNKLQAELKPNMAAAMFIMKCQGGWKETHVVEHVDPTAGATERLNAALDSVLAAFDEDGRAALEAAAAADRGRAH